MTSAKTRFVACLGIATALGASVASAQQLWTVDDNAAADFTTIQDAVNAAANGDAILVQSGNYAGFQVVGKGLAILGDPLAPPQLSGPITIAQTAAGQTVVVAQLTQTFAIWPYGSSNGLTVSSCAGALRIEDCTFRGQKGGPAGSGVRVDQSGDVIFSASTAQGGEGIQVGNTGFSTSYGGGHAGDVILAQVALYQSNLEAGAPGTNNGIHNMQGLQGGSGLRVDGSFVFSSDVRMHGGQGGCHSLTPFYCGTAFGAGAGGDGGYGLWLVGGPSNVNVQKPNLISGAAGVTNCPTWYENGHSGSPFRREASGSIAKRVNAQPRALSAPVLLSGTTTVNATVTGVAGDLVYLVVETTPHFQYDAALHGVWSLSYPPQPAAVPDGVVAGNGSVNIQLTLPALQAGQEAQTYFVQPYVVDLAGQAFAGTPRSVTLL
jgi:hypothetical protein